MLHSEIPPEHDCGGELIELPEDEPTYVHFAQCARCGTEFTFVPDSLIGSLLCIRGCGPDGERPYLNRRSSSIEAVVQ